ncbi:hypothetical protein C8Q73DRAFT_3977 [Cubamyces lactineus]|nr:hypothetical protein C8Q73DRAFT_3977 [Cubamyces lactineus]
MRVHAYLRSSLLLISNIDRLFETLHTIAPMHSCYHYLITNYFRPAAVEQGVWSLNVTPTIATAISLLAEGFFVRRVSLIGTKSSIIALISTLCLATNGGMNIVLTVKAFKIEDIQRFGQDTKTITGVTLLLAAVADYLLAGSMILALRRTKGQHARAPRSEMVTVYILNTGFLTGFVLCYDLRCDRYD